MLCVLAVHAVLVLYLCLICNSKIVVLFVCFFGDLRPTRENISISIRYISICFVKALSHYNVLLQRVPMCEKFVQHVNVR